MLLKSENRGLLLLMPIIVCTALILYAVRHRDVSATIHELAQRDSVVVSFTQFDPNTVSYKHLMSFGMSRLEAMSIIRYREAGKIYRFREDILSCEAVSDSLYYILEPYIIIGEGFKFKPKYESSAPIAQAATLRVSSPNRVRLPLSQFRVDTVRADYFVAAGVLSPRQAEVFINYRNQFGMSDIEALRRCYVVSDSVVELLEPYIIFPEVEVKLVDINRADSAELRSVVGIGAKSVVAILDYRKMLGGFHSVEQLLELREVTEDNFSKIVEQIICNNYDISKIDVNFASAKEISRHPYVGSEILRRLLSKRELKGGWSTVEEMILDDILTEEEAIMLRPYLEFTVPNTN